MPRKQDRYADKAANQIRINGETITAGQNVREFAERTGDQPADSLRKGARYARQRRKASDDLAIRSKARRTGGTTLGTQGNGVRQGPTRS